MFACQNKMWYSRTFWSFANRSDYEKLTTREPRAWLPMAITLD
jgi:hypothetical protein